MRRNVYLGKSLSRFADVLAVRPAGVGATANPVRQNYPAYGPAFDIARVDQYRLRSILFQIRDETHEIAVVLRRAANTRCEAGLATVTNFPQVECQRLAG